MKSKVTSNSTFRRFGVVIPIIVAVAVIAVLLSIREGPQRLPPKEKAKAVRVIEVQPVTLVPRAIGYGHAEPGQKWQAVAQVIADYVDITDSYESVGGGAQGLILAGAAPYNFARYWLFTHLFFLFF